MQFKLEILFNTFNELDEFVAVYKKINIRSEIKAIKTVEKRGCKTSELHKKAKEYKKLHPEMAYRECLVNVGKNKEGEEIDDESIESDTQREYNELRPIFIKCK